MSDNKLNPEPLTKEAVQRQSDSELPIDARLLSDAIIEFNISRRNVGVYPKGHSIISSSIDRSWHLFEQLFELRQEITLGIAHDALVIDRNILDRSNPVFRECALSFHEHGIASITFIAGMSNDELTSLHELLTQTEVSSGKEFMEAARAKGMIRIRIEPIDYRHFAFVNGQFDQKQIASDSIWQNYLYGLLEGRLTSDDVSHVMFEIPPKTLVGVLNNAISPDSPAETYDKVIASYLRKKNHSNLSPDSMEKLLALIEGLNPALKRNFLMRTFKHLTSDMAETERFLSELTPSSFGKLAELFGQDSSVLPDSLRNIMDKFLHMKGDQPFSFDTMLKNSAVVHDIEIDESVVGMFKEDHFRSFVSTDYSEMLRHASRHHATRETFDLKAMKQEMHPESVDRTFMDILLELIEYSQMSNTEYLELAGKLSELSKSFIETGRFEEVLHIHNIFYTHSINGKFRHEAQGTLTYFFLSDDFIKNLVDSLRVWGRLRREEAVRLIRAFKPKIIAPLMIALTNENDPSRRRFLISLLAEFRSDAVPEALRNLKDERWYVLRNMLVILYECDTGRSVDYVRKLAKHPDYRVTQEAVKYLLKFSSREGVSYLKLHLESKEPPLRMQAAKMAGAFRVQSIAPILLERLLKKEMTQHASEEKIQIVKTLGEIGNPSVLGDLLHLCKERRIVFRGAHDELKLEIFKSLAHYPPLDLKGFVDFGLHSTNETIRCICEKLAQDVIQALKGHKND